MPDIQIRESRTAQKTGRKSTAFIVESLLLLVFLIASLAIVVQLFAASINKSTQSLHLERAVIAATNAAEEFSADPTGVVDHETDSGLLVTYDITPKHSPKGTLFDATISVYDQFGEIYSLRTSRYESGVGR